MTRKRFEEEMYKRMNQAHFTESTERRLYELEEKVRNLQWKVDNIEQREEFKTPVQGLNIPTAPYTHSTQTTHTCPQLWHETPSSTCKADGAAETGSSS